MLGLPLKYPQGNRGPGMRTRVVLLVVLVAATTLVAGCLGGVGPDADSASAPGEDVEDADPGWARRALMQGSGHNHTRPDHHQGLSTSNFELQAFDPAVTDHDGETTGAYFCQDARQHEGQRYTVAESLGRDVAFTLIDISDPDEPVKVGELVMPNANTYDIALTPDLEHVVLGTSVFDSGPDGTGSLAPQAGQALGQDIPTPQWRNFCTGETQPVPGMPSQAPYYAGVALVDIKTPSEPRIVDFRSMPLLGGHSVRTAEIDGQELVLTSVFDYGRETSYYALFEVAETLDRGRLDLVTTYNYDVAEEPVDAPDKHLADRKFGAHDGFLAEHPVTGDTLAYLAYGPHGLILLDIDDPLQPEVLGRWHNWSAHVGPAGGHMDGHYAHDVRPAPTTWEGRHYTILAEECHTPPPHTPTCFIALLDTTDPADPEFVSYWTFPEMVEWDHIYQFSLHHNDVDWESRTMFVAGLHGGVWAVDISEPDASKRLPSIGAYVPAKNSPEPPTGEPSLVGQLAHDSLAGLDDRPTVMDVEVTGDGSVVAWGSNSGMYALDFDASNPAPAAPAWPVD